MDGAHTHARPCAVPSPRRARGNGSPRARLFPDPLEPNDPPEEAAPLDTPLPATGARLLRPAARPAFRRLGVRIFASAQAETRSGETARASYHFEQAALTFRLAGDPLAGAVAFLEHAATLLALGRRDEVPGLAARIRTLTAPEWRPPEGLPELGFLFLALAAKLVEGAKRKPRAIHEIVAELRRTSGRLQVLPSPPR